MRYLYCEVRTDSLHADDVKFFSNLVCLECKYKQNRHNNSRIQSLMRVKTK